MSVTEQQFQDLADAANLANSAGKRELALRLDIMARKANASLAFQRAERMPGAAYARPKRITWRHVPSCLLSATNAPGATGGES